MLLLDEPLAGISGQVAEAFVQRLAALEGRFATVLIEHDMEAVFALADRISVLVYGEIIASSLSDAIRNDPKVRAASLG